MNTFKLSPKQAWSKAWQSPPHKLLLIVGSALIFSLLSLLPLFFNTIEKRKGATMNDWLLTHLPPHNVSNYVFLLIWGMGFLIFIRALYRPIIFTQFIWMYFFIFLARVVSITSFPLEPPHGLIQLKDPLTGIFYGEANITRDLFFSGHTATLFLIFLLLEKRTDKIMALASTIIVGVLLIVQHIHYTIDVLAAPVVVYAIFVITRKYIFRDLLNSKKSITGKL